MIILVVHLLSAGGYPDTLNLTYRNLYPTSGLERMAVRDSIVYASFGGIIRIYNLNAPDPTQEIGEYRLPFPLYRNRWPGNGIYSMTTHRDFLLLATSNGLAVLRIKSDTVLSLVALNDTMIYWHIRSEGKNLFGMGDGVTNQYGNLHLLTLNTGGTIEQAFTWININNFTVIDDTILFLAKSANEDICYIYNISDPRHPYPITAFQVDTGTGYVASMFSDWERDRLYLIASLDFGMGHKLFSFDVSDPTSVKRLYKQVNPVWNDRRDAIFDTNSLALGVVSNDYRWWGYLLLELSSDDSARTLDSMDCLAGNAGIRNAWDHKFIVRLYDTLYYFDISGDSLNIFTKKRLSGVTVADFTRDGRYGYMTLNPDFCLTILDLWDIDNPRVIARVVDTSISRCGGIAQKGNRLYIMAADSTILIYSISNPSSPNLVGKFHGAGSHLEIHGNLLFTVSYPENRCVVSCYDISGTIPVLVSDTFYYTKDAWEVFYNDTNGKDGIIYMLMSDSIGKYQSDLYLLIFDFNNPKYPKINESKLWTATPSWYEASYTGSQLRKAVFGDTLYLYNLVGFTPPGFYCPVDTRIYCAKFLITNPVYPVFIDSVIDVNFWRWYYVKNFVVTKRGLWFSDIETVTLLRDFFVQDTVGYVEFLNSGYLCSDENGLIYSKDHGSGLVLVADTADIPSSPPSDTLPNPDLSYFFPTPSVFRDGARFIFGLKVDAHVKITAYNILGQAVDLLLDEFLEAGEYVVEWKPQLPSGVYIIGIKTGDEKPSVTVRVVHAR